ITPAAQQRQCRRCSLSPQHLSFASASLKLHFLLPHLLSATQQRQCRGCSLSPQHLSFVSGIDQSRDNACGNVYPLQLRLGGCCTSGRDRKPDSEEPQESCPGSGDTYSPHYHAPCTSILASVNPSQLGHQEPSVLCCASFAFLPKICGPLIFSHYILSIVLTWNACSAATVTVYHPFKVGNNVIGADEC
ncbi:hypothetical protein B0H19DRAFT_1230121, partial [Mycena capillaripes]